MTKKQIRAVRKIIQRLIDSYVPPELIHYAEDDYTGIILEKNLKDI